jgi:Calpain family cysteine protease
VAAEIFQDVDGLLFPEHTKRWLDQWQRPSGLTSTSNMPVVDLEPASGKGLPGGASGRVFKGALYFGHINMEWLVGQILLVQQAQSQIPKGQYLFELIHPQDKNGFPIVSETGKYSIKLWICGAWRTVVVDDRIPLDLFGRPLVAASRPPQLWPILLSKAIFKVMATYQILDRTGTHEVLPAHAHMSASAVHATQPLY